MSVYDDSLSYGAAKIQKNVDRLLLLSKDTENFQWAATESNSYFTDAFADRNISQLQIRLSPMANSQDAEICILQNELSLLNELVQSDTGAELQLSPVHENAE